MQAPTGNTLIFRHVDDVSKIPTTSARYAPFLITVASRFLGSPRSAREALSYFFLSVTFLGATITIAGTTVQGRQTLYQNQAVAGAHRLYQYARKW
jgi:hypothetical protein